MSPGVLPVGVGEADAFTLCWRQLRDGWIHAYEPPPPTAKEQVSFNFMAAVTVTVIGEPKKIQSLTASMKTLLL